MEQFEFEFSPATPEELAQAKAMPSPDPAPETTPDTAEPPSPETALAELASGDLSPGALSVLLQELKRGNLSPAEVIRFYCLRVGVKPLPGMGLDEITDGICHPDKERERRSQREREENQRDLLTDSRRTPPQS